MKTGLADNLLVEKAKNGDVKAFSFLVAKYQNKIAAVLSKYVDIDDVADVAQDSFIKAYQSLRLFREDSSFYTWLYRIAVNTAKNHLAKNNSRVKSVDIDINEIENFEIGYLLKDKATPESLLNTEKLKQTIFATIEELPVELKKTLILREIEGYDYEAIAEETKVPIGTVRSRLSKARAIIEKKIKIYL